MVKEGFKLITNEEGEEATECQECGAWAWGECETEADYKKFLHHHECKNRYYRK